jgi:hypothetical protein
MGRPAPKSVRKKQKRSGSRIAGAFRNLFGRVLADLGAQETAVIFYAHSAASE